MVLRRKDQEVNDHSSSVISKCIKCNSSSSESATIRDFNDLIKRPKTDRDDLVKNPFFPGSY